MVCVAPRITTPGASRARPRPSMLIEMPRFFSGSRKSAEVNWEP
jgi:hypothetical protein